MTAVVTSHTSTVMLLPGINSDQCYDILWKVKRFGCLAVQQYNTSDKNGTYKEAIIYNLAKACCNVTFTNDKNNGTEQEIHVKYKL